jgi:hypothetical protein
MSRERSIWKLSAFAAAVTVALGFGAVQAFAAPGDSANVRRTCLLGDCVRICGGQGMSGYCAGQACVCDYY